MRFGFLLTAGLSLVSAASLPAHKRSSDHAPYPIEGSGIGARAVAHTINHFSKRVFAPKAPHEGPVVRPEPQIPRKPVGGGPKLGSVTNEERQQQIRSGADGTKPTYPKKTFEDILNEEPKQGAGQENGITVDKVAKRIKSWSDSVVGFGNRWKETASDSRSIRSFKSIDRAKLSAKFEKFKQMWSSPKISDPKSNPKGKADPRKSTIIRVPQKNALERGLTIRNMHQQNLDYPEFDVTLESTISIPAGKIGLPDNVAADRGPITVAESEALKPRWPTFEDDVPVVPGRPTSVHENDDEGLGDDPWAPGNTLHGYEIQDARGLRDYVVAPNDHPEPLSVKDYIVDPKDEEIAQQEKVYGYYDHESEQWLSPKDRDADWQHDDEVAPGISHEQVAERTDENSFNYDDIYDWRTPKYNRLLDANRDKEGDYVPEMDPQNRHYVENYDARLDPSSKHYDQKYSEDVRNELATMNAYAAEFKKRDTLASRSVIQQIQNDQGDDVSQTNNYEQQIEEYIDFYHQCQQNVSTTIWPVIATMLQHAQSELVYMAALSIFTDLTRSTVTVNGPFYGGLNSLDSMEQQAKDDGFPQAYLDMMEAVDSIVAALYDEAWTNATQLLNQTTLMSDMDLLASYLMPTNDTLMPAEWNTLPEWDAAYDAFMPSDDRFVALELFVQGNSTALTNGTLPGNGTLAGVGGGNGTVGGNSTVGGAYNFTQVLAFSKEWDGKHNVSNDGTALDFSRDWDASNPSGGARNVTKRWWYA